MTKMNNEEKENNQFMAKRKNRILSLVFFFFWLPFLSFFLFLNSVDVCVRVCVCLFEREQNIKQNYTGCILQPTVHASSYISNSKTYFGPHHQ